MTISKTPIKVADGIVVTMHYTLFVDGELFESSFEDEPIAFLQGHGNIIPGLENELYHLELGEEKEISVTPEDGYGLVDNGAIKDIPINEFPESIPLEPDVELEMKDNEGDTLMARVISTGKDWVKLDFNHPLAGKEMRFKIKITGLRQADPEELDHGHPH